MKNLYGHTSQETAFIIDDYPYGFRLRTQIYYYIETTKNGDRFVSQTVNPKTGRLNAPKKSTYAEIMVMIQQENGYIRYKSFSHWGDEEKLDAFLEGIDQTKLNEMQIKQIKKLRAIFRVRKGITYEVTNVTYLSDEERQAHDKEQEEVQKRIRQAYALEYSRL